MSRFAISLLVSVALAAGCDGESGSAGCVPGEVRECPCDGGEPDGVQACEAGGETWSPCDCGGDTDVDTDTTWLVEPTGQRRCYDDAVEIDCPGLPCAPDGVEFCGQDAQYPGNERFFSCRNPDGTAQHPCDPEASDDETVIDTLTGLMWQRTWSESPGPGYWQPAENHCESLVWASHKDWRLPTCQELAGLIHRGRSSPAIDRVAFPDTPPVCFWTSSRSITGNYSSHHWTVDFCDGVVMIADLAQAVRCVRGGSYHKTSAHRYEVASGEDDGVVRDRATGLEWTLETSSPLSWSAALSYCEGLDLGGHEDWRLPDVAELRSIVEVAPGPDAPGFPGTPPSYSTTLWSSTSLVSNPGFAWYQVLSAHGFLPSDIGFKSNLLRAVCARGGS